MNRFLLTICILLIPLGAIGGIFYPVYQAGWSGTLAKSAFASTTATKGAYFESAIPARPI